MHPQAHIHLPLAASTRDELKRIARASGVSVTALARQMVLDGVARERHAQQQAELRAFAEAAAGGPLDLDPELEAAGIEAIGDADA